jgi:hypothetical protein
MIWRTGILDMKISFSFCHNIQTGSYLTPFPRVKVAWSYHFGVLTRPSLHSFVSWYSGKGQSVSPLSSLLLCMGTLEPPLWSSGQSSWLQIQRSGFDSRHYQIFWEVVGLERGPLSLVSTTEELLGRKSSGTGLENRDCGCREFAALTTRHPSIRKSCH